MLLITLNPQSNILDGILCAEPIDTNVLQLLIDSKLLIKWKFKNEELEMLIGNEYQQLMKYKNKIFNDYAVITYQRNKGMSYGRSNPLMLVGMFGLRKEIRHTLAGDKFEDWDIGKLKS